MNIQSPDITQNANQNATSVQSILVDGATGYIGSHLIYALSKAGLNSESIRCLVRKNASSADINCLQATGTNVVQADLNGDLHEAIFSKVDVACHLIGSIAPRRGETSTSLHVEQTTNFVRCCLNSKIKKIIMVSACGADPEAQSEYHRTKWQAERIIENSGIPSIILRPSLVLGRITGNRNSKLIARMEDLIRNKKLVPLIAGGKNNLQPVFIGDLIDAIQTSIFDNSPTSQQTIYELGGPEILTLRQLVQKMMAYIGITRQLMDLPIAAATAAAHLAELAQDTPIISLDQIKLAQQDNVCQDNQLESLIKRPSASIDEALSSYGWNT